MLLRNSGISSGFHSNPVITNPSIFFLSHEIHRFWLGPIIIWCASYNWKRLLALIMCPSFTFLDLLLASCFLPVKYRWALQFMHCLFMVVHIMNCKCCQTSKAWSVLGVFFTYIHQGFQIGSTQWVFQPNTYSYCQAINIQNLHSSLWKKVSTSLNWCFKIICKTTNIIIYTYIHKIKILSNF